jgi:hypothetical protein
MSTQFRLLHNFVRRDDIRFCPKGAVEHVEAKRKQNCDRSPLHKVPAPLRDGHIVLYAVEASITLRRSRNGEIAAGPYGHSPALTSINCATSV